MPKKRGGNKKYSIYKKLKSKSRRSKNNHTKSSVSDHSDTKQTSTHQYIFNDNTKYKSITIHEDKIGIWGGDIGSTVWKTSYLFAKYLEHQEHQTNFISSAENIFIELGSGTGILGMIIGRMKGNIMCTEQQHSLDLLSMNVKSNELEKKVVTYPLEWGNNEHYKMFKKKFIAFLNGNGYFKKKDNKVYIIVADCVYLGILHEILLDAINEIIRIIMDERFVRFNQNQHNDHDRDNDIVLILFGYQSRNKENENTFWNLVNEKYTRWKYEEITVGKEVEMRYIEYFKQINGYHVNGIGMVNATKEEKKQNENDQNIFCDLHLFVIKPCTI